MNIGSMCKVLLVDFGWVRDVQNTAFGFVCNRTPNAVVKISIIFFLYPFFRVCRIRMSFLCSSYALWMKHTHQKKMHFSFEQHQWIFLIWMKWNELLNCVDVWTTYIWMHFQNRKLYYVHRQWKYDNISIYTICIPVIDKLSICNIQTNKIY